LPRALDRRRELALVSGARANLATRANLAAIGQETAQRVAILVINNSILVFAKRAYAADGGTEAALLTPASVTLPTAITARSTRTGRRIWISACIFGWHSKLLLKSKLNVVPSATLFVARRISE
jgi:hypothetical protein